jgi:peptidyl-prolyl cis-trans isomerase C
MNLRPLLAVVLAGVLHAQNVVNQPIPSSVTTDLPLDTVVASIGGRKITAGEMQKIVTALPTQLQQNYAQDKKGFLKQYALLDQLAKLAEKAGLDKQSPAKERIDFARMQVLVQAQLEKASFDIDVSPDDQKKYYDANTDRFTEAKVKVIYVSYTAAAAAPAASSGKKTLNEAEAKAKAEDLVKQLRAGGDFAKLAKDNSEDPTSAGKGGDFGTIKKSDALPDDVKLTIFALKAGETSDPLKQPNGFYIFRTDEIGVQPYEKVKTEIYSTLKDQLFQKWLETTRTNLDVKFDSEAFFAQPAPPPAAAAPAKPNTAQPKK